MTSLAQTLDALVDPGSVRQIPVPLRSFGGDYGASLERARARSGVDEAVQVMYADVAGWPVVVIGGEFGFLAGSVGQSAADRVVAGYQAATRDRLPVITLPTSGGTRMQEGATAFFRMTDIAWAAEEHERTGCVRIGWLRNPTTGGVMATWGSYAYITAAEPGALLGFLGPRVYEVLHGEPFPPVQPAENLARVGVIDDVVELADLRGWVSRILSVTNGKDEPVEVGPGHEPVRVDAWEAVTRTRAADRPGPLQVLDLLTERTDLHGTGSGETGTGIQVSLGRIRGWRVAVVAQTRQEVTPADLRMAQRGIRLAARLGLPVVTLVDTPGGELSGQAEESAMAGEIARTMALLHSVQVPSVCCIMGQGCGGAALALIPAKMVICMENGWVSPLPPEGASAIMHRTPDRAADMARQQRVGALDLLDAEVIDVVVGEGPDLVGAVADAVARGLEERK
ncbi:MAG TPA: carboxyl transferase domain-containing protein [Actinomycetota bacterium]|nr:carboxyl transferase domain-containing protein [Actinomycetota bacterium]